MRYMHTKHNCASDVKNVSVLVLNSPILLGSMSTRNLMDNAMVRTKTRNIMLRKLQSVISL